MKIVKHIKQLKKRAKQIEDECHQMFLDGHINQPDQYVRISELNLIIDGLSRSFDQVIA